MKTKVFCKQINENQIILPICPLPLCCMYLIKGRSKGGKAVWGFNLP